MKSAVFDIECTDFDAIGAGILVCASVFDTETKEIHTFRLDDYSFKPNKKCGYLEQEERAELQELLEKLGQYDLLIGHNILKFDLKYLMTRALRRDVEYNLRPFAYDTFAAFRRVGIQTRPNGFGKPSAGFGAVADAFGITESMKTVVYSGEWWMEIWGNKDNKEKAFDAVVAHCESDVKLTYGVYQEILPKDFRANIKRAL